MPALNFTSYCDLWNYKDSTDNSIKNADKAFTANAARPGVEIMTSLAPLLRSGDTAAMKVEGLFRVFVEYSRSHDWSWSGFGACGFPRVLDGKTGPLECQAFAVGLMALMIAPPPFGLGVAPSEVKIETYVGKLVKTAKVGFIAHHPPDKVLNLAPNVKPVAVVDDALSPGFYRWRNHKVVKYGGKFFDPSYGCQYESLDDMVYLEIEDFGIKGSAVADFISWDNGSENDETGNYYLKCKSRQNRTYYFKVRKASLQADNVLFEGPFEAL